MAASIYPDYPLALTPEQSDYLLSNIKDWSILNGLAVRPSPAFIPRDLDSSGSLAVTAPVTLFPSLFPRSCFEEARAIQIVYNELYASIARDEEWLKEIVEEYEQSLSFLSKSPQFYSSILECTIWGLFHYYNSSLYSSFHQVDKISSPDPSFTGWSK